MDVSAASVSAVVRERAVREPDRVCLTFHGPGGRAEAISYGTLARRADAWTTVVAERGLGPPDAVVLFADSTPGFVAAFLGAQAGGLLAVPCPPPEPLETARRVRERVADIVARVGARAFLHPGGSPPGDDDGAGAGAGAPVIEGAEADRALARAAAPGRPPREGPFAYCQFSSGTGGQVKGVLLTHANVAANIAAMTEGFGLGPGDVLVTWLPLSHDMGLVAYVLMPLVLGLPGHLLSPVAFITHPGSWLSLITRVRGTVSAAPNFAYALCARKVAADEASGLDLSSWRIASNGSEAVTREAVEAFVRRFEPHGFRRDALLPCYGLAENTLCATSRRPGQGPRFEEVSRAALEAEGVARPAAPGRVVASVGAPLPGHGVAVLGADGRPAPARAVGEVAIRGASVMSGYLPGTPAASPFTPGGWLRTGDLGYLADGELFLVGRAKDVIVRAGRKYQPQDLEDALDGLGGVRPGRVAAFSVPGPQREQVVIPLERRPEWEGAAGALEAAVAAAVFARTGLAPDEVIVLPRNALPLTTSGKVMRPEARRLYLEDRWRS